MSDPLVKRWLEAGELDLPLPGSGQTAKRWRKLAALAEIDVVAGRLAEAHADATAILADLGAEPPKPGEFWAVWAAESAEVTLAVDEVDGIAELNGSKSWCSGAGLCTHALVTAQLRRRRPRPVRHRSSVPASHAALEDCWRNAGMKDADTGQLNSAAPPRHPSAVPASTWGARLLVRRHRGSGLLAGRSTWRRRGALPCGRRRTQLRRARQARAGASRRGRCGLWRPPTRH